MSIVARRPRLARARSRTDWTVTWRVPGSVSRTMTGIDACVREPSLVFLSCSLLPAPRVLLSPLAARSPLPDGRRWLLLAANFLPYALLHSPPSGLQFSTLLSPAARPASCPARAPRPCISLLRILDAQSGYALDGATGGCPFTMPATSCSTDAPLYLYPPVSYTTTTPTPTPTPGPASPAF
ncbi:hypothetical protein BC567DRAFT_4017 [Phyllosticta citribraziliensis]